MSGEITIYIQQLKSQGSFIKRHQIMQVEDHKIYIVKITEVIHLFSAQQVGEVEAKMGSIAGFLGLMFFGMAHGAVHHYDFFLKESNFTRLCSTKSMLVVNDSFPGPEIHVHKGDTVFVNVYNHGKYGVTLHWHGVKQPRNPWSDGPENITQCPIPPATNFTQEIIFSSEEGTLWWHAHSDWSRATVHGAIIIYPLPNTTYPYTKPHFEHTIVLASWYKADVMAVLNQSQTLGSAPNVSDAFTINGQPGDLYNCSNETMYRLRVDYGKTYLLRIINAILNEEMFFAIAKHNLTVVGADGSYMKPITTSYVVITPGQTMDVLVTTNQSTSYYYMAATPFADTVVPFDNTTTTAIVQYSGNYTPPTTTPFPSLPGSNDSDAAADFIAKLRSLASKEHPIRVPKHITKHVFIAVSVNVLPCSSCTTNNFTRNSASLNNISFLTPSIDILQAYYRNMHLYGGLNTSFPLMPLNYFNFTGDVSNITVMTRRGTKVVMINYGEAVEIVFQGTNILASENHPMHLHGFNFYLVGKGTGNFDNHTDPQSYNLVDPPQLNTIGVPKNGWSTIRFFAKNPGVWFIHCHLERHTTWGMETVLIVKNGCTKATSLRRPPAYMPPCSKTT
ncbi:Cu-oxidase domain-containing protein/Cu-oxidase_2 domain-containing protein/Cu-oxidase_3 domain-containing protein [Cephalotus follicularis]|uniref:Laccase n=1 Tax=Cephalotus follicularis TaxID=3775 RepID=A0A1Q3AW75_CEPFO|nr:Cu-oxidase domain-containing protein/Cu-oxidase_2 domain-containing protein/Cu-oxidase_3 domain-containing protein [Cephalotus follicularis]